MAPSSPEPAAPRGGLPGPLRALLVSWVVLAVLGGLIGLLLTISNRPDTTLIASSVPGLVGGVVCGSALAIGLVALYYLVRAVLRLGQKILSGSAPAAGANPSASSRLWHSVVGTCVGTLVGGMGGALLGFIGIALWIGLTPAPPEVQGQAGFLGLVFGVLWGVPLGAILGGVAGAGAGFVAGFRLRGQRPISAPAAASAV